VPRSEFELWKLKIPLKSCLLIKYILLFKHLRGDMEENNQEIKKENKNDLKKYLLLIIEKRNYIFTILSAILVLNILIFKIKPLIFKNTFDGSFLANQNYDEWKKSFFKDSDKLNQLKSVIKKNPSLKPNYDGLILQNLLIKENFGKEENALAETILERTKTELPFYYEFSKTALLISNGQLNEALIKSKN